MCPQGRYIPADRCLEEPCYGHGEAPCADAGSSPWEELCCPVSPIAFGLAFWVKILYFFSSISEVVTEE